MASSDDLRSGGMPSTVMLVAQPLASPKTKAPRTTDAADVNGPSAGDGDGGGGGGDDDDDDEETMELTVLKNVDDDAAEETGVTRVPGSTRTRPVGTRMPHHALAVPRPTSVWSATVLQIDPSKASDRISNKLEIRGTMADATTQVDPRAVLHELPSERRLKNVAGYDLRMNMESSMPYTAGLRSVTQERQEIKRLQQDPTIREARSMKAQGKMPNSFRAALTHAARVRERAERSTLNTMQRWNAAIRDFFARMRERINRMENPVWRGRLRELEAHFGGAYASYFIFVRWLFILNTIISIICIYLIVAIGIVDTDWSAIEIDFIPYVPSWQGNSTSFFFMGGYHPIMLEGSYRMDYGYFFAVIGVFVVSFVAVVEAIRLRFVKQMAHSYSYGQRAESPYATALFTSYDFSLQKQRSIRAQQKTLSSHIKELHTRDDVMKKRRESRKGFAMVIIILKRILVNIIVLGLMATMGYAIYVTIRTASVSTIQIDGVTVRVTPLVISGFNMVLPTIFGYLSIWEDYLTEVTTSRVNLARSYILKMAGIYVLLFGYIGVDQSDILGVGVCWETAVGQEFYALLWTSGILYLLSTLTISFASELFFYLRLKTRHHYSFDISSHVIQLIYMQAILWFVGAAVCAPLPAVCADIILAWRGLGAGRARGGGGGGGGLPTTRLGFAYSPVIPFVGVFLNVVIFYTTSFVLFKTGIPPKQIFSSASLNTFFLVLGLITLAATGGPIAWSMSEMTPGCGPHVNYRYPYDVVPTLIDSAPPGLTAFLDFFTTAGFIAAFILCLLIFMYWLVSINYERKKRIQELEEEMLSEREDKRYLMQFYNVQ